jgi:succinyl-CoA synthetase alpha subunit
MAILVNEKTCVLIQGISGNEGRRACREMQRYGTKVFAGVTPGRGGKKIGRVPVYNTVIDAMRHYPRINATLIAVPAPFARDAAEEAIHARIPLVNILTEHIPIRDSAYVVSMARSLGVIVVGPSSVGVISPGSGKIGSIGSSESAKVFSRGSIGVISKSGGMTSEISSVLTRAGLGQSTALGIGGDRIIGSDFADMLCLFRDDPKTRAVVLFGEIGGTYEEQAAEYILREKFSKPVVALVAGKFSLYLPEETTLGHAGAIVSGGRGSYNSKIRSLRKAGVLLANTVEEIPVLLNKKLRI